MGIEENKKIVLNFLENLSNDNIDAALGAMADTSTWWSPGNLPVSGMKTKNEFAAVAQTKADGSLWLEPMRFTIKGVTAEGGRVAVEAESYGKRSSGNVYQNQYHFLFEVRDGKIQAAREYLDTLHLKEAIFNE